MAAILLKSSIQHLSMLHMDCYHVIIGIKPCHQKLVLSISPRESVWAAVPQHKFLVTGLNPLNMSGSSSPGGRCFYNVDRFSNGGPALIYLVKKEINAEDL